MAAQIEQDKEKLAGRISGEHWKCRNRLFRLALDEAEALAWQTGYPQLVFPDAGDGKGPGGRCVAYAGNNSLRSTNSVHAMAA